MKTYIYRGKVIKVPKPIELARLGEEGKQWYKDSNESLKYYSYQKGFDLKRVADITAILSPRVSVKHNITLAKRYLEKGILEGVMVGRQKAIFHYEKTGEFYGPKVTEFSKALQGDYNAVVVDSWMVRAFGYTYNKKPSPSLIKHISKVVRSTSSLLDWKPAETQAAMWVSMRKLCGFKTHNKLLF